MEHILGITDLFLKSLQKRDQNIVEVVSMIKGRKQALVRLKTSGFDAFFKIVTSICKKHDIVVLKMDEIYVAKRNRVAGIKNRQYFEIDIFNTVLDMQIQEFGDRFGGISIDLHINMSALSPGDSFTMFDASKLITLTTFYRDDFTDANRFSLSRELDLYYEIVIHDTEFIKLTGIAELATLMVT
ncbi:zinc finger MYM-type protein 1-like protein [Tanacetum coccineum]|uniref:Zinc finger MYM-type protein 1-like protein n=1 Tax=Tanacetum coccineum TaxID=301880 RepID=A0ABQ5FYG8_9ASTR